MATSKSAAKGIRAAFQAVKEDMKSLTAWVFHIRDDHIELKHKVEMLENKIAEMEREKLLR